MPILTEVFNSTEGEQFLKSLVDAGESGRERKSSRDGRHSTTKAEETLSDRWLRVSRKIAINFQKRMRKHVF